MKKTTNCKYCGKEFSSHNINPKYCSLSCKGLIQSAGISFNEAMVMYENGKTQEEIAIHFGVTQKAIYGLFKRNKYKCRIPAKRNQLKEKNSSWKGDDASYGALHYRVEKERGKPCSCIMCNTTDISKRYEWANLTGNYQNIDDYVRMCVSCHRKFDSLRRRLTGGKTINVKR
jgi:hypothetical protein